MTIGHLGQGDAVAVDVDRAPAVGALDEVEGEALPVLVDELRVEAPPEEALGAEDGVLRVVDDLRARPVAHQGLVVRREPHHRRQDVALVGDRDEAQLALRRRRPPRCSSCRSRCRGWASSWRLGDTTPGPYASDHCIMTRFFFSGVAPDPPGQRDSAAVHWGLRYIGRHGISRRVAQEGRFIATAAR